jgi:ArsR family transcriptional regulator, nickel/cobalt-responsive transcriptional repressor
LATPSRLRILTRLRHGACSVNDLSAAVEMEGSGDQSHCAQQA